MKLYCESCKKIFVQEMIADKAEVPCPECGNSVKMPEKTPGPGVVLGDFLIEKVISKGGMGIVYLARQLSLDRHVALKVLQSKYTNDKEYVESLYHEARAAAKINHPNVVQAYAIGEDDGVFYFAMEYIKGDTFKKILKDKGGKLEFKEAARIIRDVARALSAAWREQKLVHQDIKPDNIMLDANGFAKLADLGLARSASAQEESDDSNEVLGTPQYISPEQLTGVPTDIRSDIYSLGATFYQFVTGRYAYVADSLDDLPRLHVEGNLEPPKNVNPELPDALNSIIMKMMARQPEKRYQIPEELIEDLEKYINDTGKSAAPRIGGGAVPKIKLGGGSAAVTAAGKQPQATKPAKAPLSLNLNGPKTPAAKPAVKPATPPATPPAAKPATLPAAPPAAKPATPPAAPPAAKPSAPMDVKPAVPEVKSTPQPPPVATPSKAPTPKKVDSKSEKAAAPGTISAIMKWIFIGIGALLLLVVAFVATVAILNSKGKLPGFLAPVGDFLNSQAGAAKAKALELAKPQELTETEEPQGPVTRPEYLKMIDELLNFRLLNPQKGSEFLAMADKMYPEILKAVTPEEIAARKRFFNIYSPTDEKIRCDVARKKIREKYLTQIDLAVSARNKAEQERLARIEEEKRKAAEAARIAAEIDAKNKQDKMQQDQNLAQLKKGCQEQGEKLAEAMLDAAISNDRSKLDMALLDADDFVRLTIAQSAEEKKVLGQLTGFIKSINKELKTLQTYKRRMGNIRSTHNLNIIYNKKALLVEKIQPGEIRCTTGEDRLVVVSFHKLPDSSRNRLIRQIKINPKLKQLNNPGFFIGVFDRHVDKLALKDIPAKGFWKEYWNYFSKHLYKK